MSTPTAQNTPPVPGTILVSLTVNDRGEFWKKTEFAMQAGATAPEVDAALDQADLMHARLADRMYTPAAPPPSGSTSAAEAGAAPPAPPASAATPAARAVDPANLATDKQVKAIYAIGRNARKMQPAAVDAYCSAQYQGRKPSELTKREASTLIDDLKAEQAA